jgi:hypothetical protein
MDQDPQTIFSYAANNSNYEVIGSVLASDIKSEEKNIRIFIFKNFRMF